MRVRQSLGEPDPFRFRYREQLRELIANVIRECVRSKGCGGKNIDLVEDEDRP